MWVTKANLIVYCSHFLYSWGSRMWMFAISMFLVRIADGIQLSATFGLASGLAIFFFGAIVGDWVDNTPRLKAAQLSLTLQYLLMLGCTAVVAVCLQFQQQIQDSSWLSPLLRAVIVCLGVLADLASQTRVIVVERDWVVEICSSDPDHLASMTAMLRRLDLITMVLAPLAMGQVMEHLGLFRGALFMGGWTLGSLLLQLFLTWKVYCIVPALKSLKRSRRAQEGGVDAELTGRDEGTDQPTIESKTPIISDNSDDNNDGIKQRAETNAGGTDLTPHTHEIKDDNKDTTTTGSPGADVRSERKENPNSLQNKRGDLPEHAHSDPEQATNQQQSRGAGDVKVTWLARASRIGVLHQLVTLYRGGRTYMSYTVALPGLSLAVLYLTVLSFDNITVAYIVTQGLTESDVGITMSSSAVFGVLSTFAYTFIRRRAGVVRTGFLGLFCEVSVLTLCVASVWMPGSPFDPLYQRTRQQGQLSECHGGKDGMENATTATTASFMNSSDFFEGSGVSTFANFTDINNSSSISSSSNISSLGTGSNYTCSDVVGRQGPDSYVSVTFFLAGIFLARFGVWMADLAITQLFLEHVVAAERGIVNGVQSSLNQLMNLLKFALVVALPDMETFGFHVLITFCAIATANLLYLVFVRRERVPLCSGGCRSTGRSSQEEERGEKALGGRDARCSRTAGGSGDGDSTVAVKQGLLEDVVARDLS